MDWKRRSWFGVVVVGALVILSAVALVLYGWDRPGTQSVGRNARPAFLAELNGVRARAVGDARTAAASGRFGFHAGGLDETQVDGRFPGFENCRVLGAVTVSDLFGVDERKDALRSVYGEAYNLEIVRVHPAAVMENCASPRRGERPARALGENETRFAELTRLRTPPAYVDYYICSAQRAVGDGTIDASRTVEPNGRLGEIRASWSSRSPISLSQDPHFQANWYAESDAADWTAAGGIEFRWEVYPSPGPRGSKVSFMFHDPLGRAISLRTRYGIFTENSAQILTSWSELKRAAAPNGFYAVLVAPDGRQAKTYYISAGLLDYVEQRLREALAEAAANAGDLQHRCEHITGL